MGVWFVLLHVGVILLFLPMLAAEYPAMKTNKFFGAEFERGKPRWVISGIKLSFVLFVFVFVLFLVLSRAASPEVQNGQYVLNNHGRIVRVLSEGEYLHLEGWELRMFASGWMCFYISLIAYWWFPRNRTLVL
jgi:hypothetical protein